VKPFARPSFQRGSLGYARYYGFIRPTAALCYFWHFLTGSLPFGFALQPWFSCSYIEPGKGSCRLYAVRCVTSSQVPVTLGLSRSLPFRFYRSKSYFRHLDSGLLAFNSPAPTIRTLAVQLAGCALTLSLSTIAWTTAPQGGLVNTPVHLYR
jgi:hypothetical protein